jgi:hypothetical protein
VQKDAYFADTTCSLWLRFFPFRRHVWFVGSLTTVWLAHIKLPGSFVALYRTLLNSFPLFFPANVPARLNLHRLAGKLLPPTPHDDSAIDESFQFPVESDPLLDNPPIRSRNARLSTTAQAHQTWLRQRSARWHSVVAGAVAGGVAISFETLLRQKIIMQQLFIWQVIHHTTWSRKLNTVFSQYSSLQGSYNAYSEKCRFHVPHGDIVVFALS